MFLNLEYEWAYISNSFYGNGFMNTANYGLGDISTFYHLNKDSNLLILDFIVQLMCSVVLDHHKLVSTG